jgi:hypothetical protein
MDVCHDGVVIGAGDAALDLTVSIPVECAFVPHQPPAVLLGLWQPPCGDIFSKAPDAQAEVCSSHLLRISAGGRPILGKPF